MLRGILAIGLRHQPPYLIQVRLALRQVFFGLAEHVDKIFAIDILTRRLMLKRTLHRANSFHHLPRAAIVPKAT